MQECAAAAERNHALCGAWAPQFLAMLALGQAQLEAHLALAAQVCPGSDACLCLAAMLGTKGRARVRFMMPRLGRLPEGQE